MQVKPILRIPSRHDVADLAHTLGPMSVIYLFKNFTYVLIQVDVRPIAIAPQPCRHLTQFVMLQYLKSNACAQCLQLTATGLAPVKLAAHQLLYSLWSLTSFLTVPLEQVRHVSAMCTCLWTP